MLEVLCRPSTTTKHTWISVQWRVAVACLVDHVSACRSTYRACYHRRPSLPGGCCIWNSLPETIRSSPSLPVFRSRVKTELFARSYTAALTTTWPPVTCPCSPRTYATLKQIRSSSSSTTQDEWMDSVQIKSWQSWHTTRKYESLEKEMVQGCVPGYIVDDNVNEGCVPGYIVDDNAGVGQMTSPNGLGWRSMKRQQQRKIVTVGKGYYAPPTFLMEELKALNDDEYSQYRTHLQNIEILCHQFIIVRAFIGHGLLTQTASPPQHYCFIPSSVIRDNSSVSGAI